MCLLFLIASGQVVFAPAGSRSRPPGSCSVSTETVHRSGHRLSRLRQDEEFLGCAITLSDGLVIRMANLAGPAIRFDDRHLPDRMVQLPPLQPLHATTKRAVLGRSSGTPM
jgi:hypothetical protein